MSDPDGAVDLYKAYLEDLGRIGSRHENVRTFYVSLVTALFTFLSLAGKQGVLIDVGTGVVLLTSLVGIVICVAWFSHMRSFGIVFEAKLHTLSSMEQAEGFHFKPFTAERDELHSRHYVHVTVVDRVVPIAFVLLFGALVYFKSH